MDKKFDVVIIGSGLGGLLCGYILSEEGYSVCILEKNKQLGGSLQTFVRDRCIFDTGIHYIGGLDEGQPLRQYFKYFKIIDKLKLKKLDEDGFDRFGFTGDSQVYMHAQGYDNFINRLSAQFPEERQAITNYCDSVKAFCKKFPLYNLEENTLHTLDTTFLEVNAKQHIESLTSNEKLRNILSASNSLYAGEGDKSPFYMHALIVNSYIESSYRCIDGGSQITKILTRHIFQNGGTILKHAEVVDMVMNGENLDHVKLADGREIKGTNFISNIHPASMLDMLKTDKIRKAYRSRITELENTVSVFIVNVVLKKNTFKYLNYNYYHCEHNDVWSTAKYTQESWPEGYGMFSSATSKSSEYADGITLMAYMRMDEMVEWKDTFNTVEKVDFRGESYEAFKKAKAEKLIDYVNRQYPTLRDSIETYYSSTPLTYRDYIGTKDGSLYGILKDHKDPLRSFISAKTRIPNLFLTGQNLNMHGVYGVSVAAVKTCFELIDPVYLFDKIKNA